MKHFFIRTQILLVSLVLLVTFIMVMILVDRYNKRWDLTRGKIFSLAEPTRNLLRELSDGKLEVLAFYAQDDPARAEIEVFFKQMQIFHPGLEYRFYDPDRVPRLAREHRITDPHTLIVRYQDRRERVVLPSEESFANALLRLANPRTIDLCFVTGHGEASVNREDRSGYAFFRRTLETHNYGVHEIIMSRDGIPSRCHIIVIAGPHRDLDNHEYSLLKRSFEEGKGILFLIDPMDQGTGSSFRQFMQQFGIFLGSDVIVDKMGRLVGGDFLVPLVSRYVNTHPVSQGFNMPTFYPVVRSVQPASEPRPGIEVVPLAFTGSGSWAETDLAALERGEATFDVETDLSGPLPIAVAAQHTGAKRPVGRMITVGDSDFLSNAYIDISGNRDFGLRMIQWLAKDERFITIRERQTQFKPLFLTPAQNMRIFLITVVAMPALFLLIGMVTLFIRHKTS